MNTGRVVGATSFGLAAGAGIAAVGYAGLVALNRLRYGRVATAPEPGPDSALLDRFIPVPEIVERHHVRIDAPADVVLAAAKEMRMLDSALVRSVIRWREIAMGAEPAAALPEALLPQMLSIGWVVLAERAGREIVMGAVTRPWEANAVFRPIPAPDFAAFREPGYVKIAWTLRAEPAGDHASDFHTETRASTTDPQARARFRKYWSYVAPGVKLIRVAMLGPIKKAAEQRVRKGGRA